MGRAAAGSSLREPRLLHTTIISKKLLEAGVMPI
jgi:hypothetical protein